MKTENLKRMYNDLAAGYTVNVNGCSIYRGRGSRGKDLFFWRNFGSSAETVSLQNLRFICRDIAKSEDYSYILVTPNGYTIIEKALKAGLVHCCYINNTNVHFYDITLLTGETVTIERYLFDSLKREKLEFVNA